jgi:hypothetical protein
LIVVAKGTASVEPLLNWITRPATWGMLEGPAVDADVLYEAPLESVTWSGSTITRLRGVVSPSQMKRDFEIEIGARPGESQRIRVVSARSVAALRLNVAIGFGGFAAIALACVLAMRGTPTASRILLCALSALVCGGVAYALSCSSMERLEPEYFRVTA